jgi:hypothetical protein
MNILPLLVLIIYLLFRVDRFRRFFKNRRAGGVNAGRISLTENIRNVSNLRRK